MSASELRLVAERDRALAALWNIRMAAERSTVDEHPSVLPNRIIALALGGMGGLKDVAQRLAAERST